MSVISRAVRRIVAGRPQCKSRWHDEKGNRIGPGGGRYALAALASAAAKRICGYRPTVPMISYRARKRIAGLMAPDWRMIEFGSGRSSIWFAARCASVLAIEHDRGWHDLVAQLAARAGLRNLMLLLRPPDGYADLSAIPDGHFDFAMVDGIVRDRCIDAVLPKIRNGGWLYLDNTDKDPTGGEMRRAEERLLAFVAAHPRCTVEYFTDMAPTNFFAEQGMLVHVNHHGGDR